MHRLSSRAAKKRRRFSAQAGLAGGVVVRRHADRAAASKLIGQRVGLMRRGAKFCGRNDAGVVVSKVNARHDRRDRHGDEAERASPGADVERIARASVEHLRGARLVAGP